MFAALLKSEYIVSIFSQALPRVKFHGETSLLPVWLYDYITLKKKCNGCEETFKWFAFKSIVCITIATRKNHYKDFPYHTSSISTVCSSYEPHYRLLLIWTTLLWAQFLQMVVSANNRPLKQGWEPRSERLPEVARNSSCAVKIWILANLQAMCTGLLDRQD